MNPFVIDGLVQAPVRVWRYRHRARALEDGLGAGIPEAAPGGQVVLVDHMGNGAVGQPQCRGRDSRSCHPCQNAQQRTMPPCRPLHRATQGNDLDDAREREHHRQRRCDGVSLPGGEVNNNGQCSEQYHGQRKTVVGQVDPPVFCQPAVVDRVDDGNQPGNSDHHREQRLRTGPGRGDLRKTAGRRRNSPGGQPGW